jgi:phosphoribosylformimino-5-aminoimidazole carboxamide ribotide isomerase
MRLHDFSILYVADLDAILSQGNNWRYIHSIGRLFPDLTLWLDVGLRDASDLTRWQETGDRSHPVLGSESLSDIDTLRHPALQDSERYPVLSLDFQGGQFLGPLELRERPSLWPERVIVMTLARVGSRLGPDLIRLRHLSALSPTTAFYAAGGVRNAYDLRALSALGVRGALVASALHAGAIDAQVLAAHS